MKFDLIFTVVKYFGRILSSTPFFFIHTHFFLVVRERDHSDDCNFGMDFAGCMMAKLGQ